MEPLAQPRAGGAPHGQPMPAAEACSERKAARLTELAFWRAYLTTTRPYLFPISALAGLAGMSLAPVTASWRWAGALVVFSLSYGLGQALTDCFQTDTDRLSAPDRPLVDGWIASRDVLVLSLGALLTGALVLTVLNPWSLLVCLAAVGGLLVYTPLKRRWWAGPVANAWVVALLPVTGWLVASGGRLIDLWEEPRVLAAALMSFAAYGNFVLAGYLKDVRADRATGYQTFPVRFGWRRTVWASDAWALAAVALGAWTVHRCGGTSGSGYVPVIPFVGAAILSLYAQVNLHRTHREEDVHRPLINVVRVLLLLEAAVVCAATPGWWPLAVGLDGAFELLVRVRPDRGQV